MGYTSPSIMLEELRETAHVSRSYYKAITQAIVGDKATIRKKIAEENKKNIVSVVE